MEPVLVPRAVVPLPEDHDLRPQVLGRVATITGDRHVDPLEPTPEVGAREQAVDVHGDLVDVGNVTDAPRRKSAVAVPPPETDSGAAKGSATMPDSTAPSPAAGTMFRCRRLRMATKVAARVTATSSARKSP